MFPEIRPPHGSVFGDGFGSVPLGGSLSTIPGNMHEEKAYIETMTGEIIPFSLAKEIRAF